MARTTPKTKNMKKQVGFSTIEIIELPVILGDNPSVSSGAPLTIGWKAQKRIRFQLDFFETHRPKRRSKDKLRMSAEERELLLLHQGHTLHEIYKATRTVKRRRVQRIQRQMVEIMATS